MSIKINFFKLYFHSSVGFLGSFGKGGAAFLYLCLKIHTSEASIKKKEKKKHPL